MSKFTYEEKKELVYDIAQYIIKENKLGHKVSTRVIAQQFSISNATVSDWMKNILKEEYPSLYCDVDIILRSNRSLITDKKVKKRVLNIARLVLDGYKYSDIIDYYQNESDDKYFLTDSMIHHDLYGFLPQIDSELFEKIKVYLHEHSLDNLTPGNSLYVDQERDKSGRFK